MDMGEDVLAIAKIRLLYIQERTLVYSPTSRRAGG